MKIYFEWDRIKANANLRKHHVSFQEAETVFDDPLMIVFPDEDHSENEDRLIGIGMSAASKILLVVHLEREKTEEDLLIRIISCRRATTNERKTYEEN